MPVIHIYTAEGFLSPARKKLMIEKVTRAAVEAEGLPTTNRTYVLIHDVPDVVGGGRASRSPMRSSLLCYQPIQR
jgi:phenylpyruvate tautomerase PptA (4-oxalocrotonate tautomerase family)